jgi:hypothetical protein
MDDLIKSRKLHFEKSSLNIEIFKKISGAEYIKISQIINFETNSSILINPNNLEGIISALIEFKEDIFLDKKSEEKIELIKHEDFNKIIFNFLRGVTIKELSFLYGYKQDSIREFLIQQEIEIIEGIEISPKNQNFNLKYKKKKK